MFTKIAPLPGESFWSQVPTHWLRDPRLRGLDKAVLGYLQTHEVGYRVTMEQLIAEMYEGKDALYASVARLVELGYLVRAQGRTDEGKFEAVDYTFGPSAFEATYARNWGRRDTPGVSAGQTASGFSATGETGTGQPGTGKGDTKKIRVKRSKKVTPPTPPPDVPAAAPPTPIGGGIDQVEDTPDTGDLTELVDQVHAARGWSKTLTRRVVAEIAGEGRPWAMIVTVMNRIVADPASQGPGRLRAVPQSWWSVGEHGPARRPGELRRRPHCGACVEQTRLTDDDRPRPCPACSPQAAGMVEETMAA